MACAAKRLPYQYSLLRAWFQPGENSVCNGLPAQFEHAVVRHIRDDFVRRGVCSPCCSDFTRGQHVVTGHTQHKQMCLHLARMWQIEGDHIEEGTIRVVLHLSPIRSELAQAVIAAPAGS